MYNYSNADDLQNTQTKVIAVARVSTEEQEDAGNSLTAQINRIERYCEYRKLTIVKRFEIQESAFKNRRDKFDEFIEYLNKQKNKVIVCFDKVDRLTRNVYDTRVNSLFQRAKEGKLEIHFVSDGQTMKPGVSASEKFNFNNSINVAEYYSNAISDNVKRAFEKLRSEGVWVSKARFGYKNVRTADDKKTIEPDPINAPLIKLMFQLYASGKFSLETLNDEMFGVGLKNSKGNKLTRSSIENMLKDTFYHGIAMSKIHGSYPHKYKPLISKELFDKCQEVMEGKRKRPKNKYKVKDYIFRGLLSCKHCGCAISPELKVKKNGKKYTYYSCTNAKGNCRREYINENVLLEQTYKVLKLLGNIPEERIKTLVTKLNNSTKNELANNRRQVDRIRKEVQGIEDRQSRLLDLYSDGGITKDAYHKKTLELDDRLAKLKDEFEQFNKTEFNHEITLSTVLSLAKRAKDIFASSEVKEKWALASYLLQN
ncbi:MAG: recombinase family protein, partial [Candidatus Uhrbacteria bacterium]